MAAEPGLRIAWVDVEGGAATLLVTPANETVLIDTGNAGRRDPERIVKAIAGFGLRRVDHLITTHYHTDHYGGAATLAELLPIGTVYDNGEFLGMPDKPDPSYWSFKCEKRTVLEPNATIPLKSAAGSLPVEIVVLGNKQQFVADDAAPDNEAICAGLKTKARDGSDNANSVVLLVKYGMFRFFAAGDLTWNMENKLVCPKNLIGDVDVYQVTHHGLDASNNPLVLQTIKPTVAIMSNGTTKGCMPEMFASLKAEKSIQALYQMHKNLRPDGAENNVPEKYIANLEKDCNANTIQLAVASDAKTYRVSLPHSGHSREFTTRVKAASAPRKITSPAENTTKPPTASP
jgi:hypothetical protein